MIKLIVIASLLLVVMANVNGLSMTPVKPDDTEMMMEERSGDGMGMAKFMMDDEGGDDEEMRNSKKESTSEASSTVAQMLSDKIDTKDFMPIAKEEPEKKVR